MAVTANSNSDTPTNERSRVYYALALVWAAVLLPRILAALLAIAPAKDAFRYLDAADQFKRHSLANGLQSCQGRPLYPFALYVADQSYATVFGKPPVAMMRWRLGQGMGIAAYLAFLTAAFWAGGRLWNYRIACLGCVLTALLPRQVGYSIDLLADPLHAAWWMISFALLVRCWECPSVRAALLAGVCSGIALLTRTEAVVLPIAAVVALALSWLYMGRPKPARLPLLAATAYGGGLAVPLLVFVGLAGDVWGSHSATHSVWAILGNATPSQVQVPTERRTVEHWLVTASVAHGLSPNETELDDHASRRRPTWIALPWELAQETRFWPLLLALLGILSTRNMLRLPAGFLAMATIFCQLAVLAILHVKAGYLTSRYLTPVIPLVAMFAGHGMERLWRFAISTRRFPWEQRWTIAQWTSRRRMACAATLVLLTLTTCVSGWIVPAHRYRWGHRLAADWLRHNSSPAAVVFDPMRLTAFLAERTVWDAAVTDFSAVDYVVVDPAYLYRCDPPTFAALTRAHQIGHHIQSFPRRTGSSQTGVYLLELPHALIADRSTRMEGPQ